MMKKIFEGRKERDEYDIFGEQVACKLRKLSNYSKLSAQHIINNVLLEAELGKYDERPSIPSYNPILISSPGINYNTHPTNQYLPINSAFDISQPSSSYSFPTTSISQPTPQQSSEIPQQTSQNYMSL